jgi:hypothetical protein
MARGLVLAMAVAAGVSATPARADELAAQGREILERNQRAVVTVQAVLKLTASGGRSSESKLEITGTVIDPSGLAVVALSACDPTEMYRRVSEDYRVEIEVSETKMLMPDGVELPAEIVLRDRDFDLAFLRPKAKPAGPMAAIDLSRSGTAQALDELITLSRLNPAAGRACAASVERVAAVIQKPRTFYVPDTATTATALGAPAFLPSGKVLGLVVMRAVSSAGGKTSDYRQNLTAMILPAEDILKASKQAPEAAVEGEKKEPPKDTKEKE